MPQLDENIVDQHEQKYNLSCIPSTVELILKLLNRVPVDYYKLQDEWQNRNDGSFTNFDGRTIEGIQ